MTTWLDLLLADVPVEDMHRHGEGLAEGERQLEAALQLRALLEQRRRRAAELTALNDVAAQLTSTHVVDDLLQEIAVQARRLLGVDLAYIGLIRGDETVFEVVSGGLTTQLLGRRIPRSAGMLGLVIGRGEPYWTSDYTGDTAFRGFDDIATAEQLHALLGVPLQIRERVLGALFACKRSERHFTDDEVALLASLASHAAIAIDNATTLQRHRETAAELQAANRRLERTLAWDRQLTRVVLRGGGVEELVAEIAAAASGRVVLLDKGAPAPADLAQRFPALSDALASISAHPRSGPSALGEGSDAVLVAGVVADREVLATLLVVDGEDDADDLLLLERAAPAVALAMVRERAVSEATRLTRDAMAIDLLTRPASDPRALRQRMRNAGLDPATAYCVIAAAWQGEVPRDSRDDLTTGLPAHSVVVPDGDRLVAIVPTQEPNALVRDWSAGSRHGATAGVAGPAERPMQLHNCYTDAVATLDALLTLGRHGEAATAEQLGLYRILLTHTGRRAMHAQFDHELGPVLREQQRRSIPMLATMKAYLDHGGRVAPAARALGVHVNTIYQRVAVLDDLLGDSWRKPPRSLDLHILLRIMSTPGLAQA
ncbi:helix-turn-helix domain-containing protein [Pseudonocardia sp. CA-142604]|uniref:helix-turn-helix domain-containing protein n=1 Tax=Pseudonocardia sp. CA-142604 TaxID=3240024 RepID=UPI003D8BD5D3